MYVARSNAIDIACRSGLFLPTTGSCMLNPRNSVVAFGDFFDSRTPLAAISGVRSPVSAPMAWRNESLGMPAMSNSPWLNRSQIGRSLGEVLELEALDVRHPLGVARGQGGRAVDVGPARGRRGWRSSPAAARGGSPTSAYGPVPTGCWRNTSPHFSTASRQTTPVGSWARW